VSSHNFAATREEKVWLFLQLTTVVLSEEERSLLRQQQSQHQIIMNTTSRNVTFRGRDIHEARKEQRRQRKLNEQFDQHDDDSSEGSLDPLTAVAQQQQKSPPMMDHLHSSYGNHNSSLNNLSLSAFQSCSSGLNVSDSNFQSPMTRASSPSPRKQPNKVPVNSNNHKPPATQKTHESCNQVGTMGVVFAPK